MKRIAKEIRNNHKVYTYEVENQRRVTYLVFNHCHIFKNSISAYGGWDMLRQCYTVEIHYPL